ncbi:NTP transferase domain-containing protein [Propioniciclava soli]|uniref:nucleotidyltransferase family protein n=1 Tax=Propioniciclava soli TaxID=2775081 RepID=UPI001E3DA235
MSTHGLLLAAGAGTRFGGPKALARDADGSAWLLRALAALRPCAGITVVLGAGASQAAGLVPPSVRAVLAARWADGLGASLRAGLDAVAASDHDAVLVSLVDLPDVDARVTQRVLAAASGASALARATYGGVPGHPVLLGRAHWDGVLATAVGDRGAGSYLAAHIDRVRGVECGDLASGADVDVNTGAGLRPGGVRA